MVKGNDMEGHMAHKDHKDLGEVADKDLDKEEGLAVQGAQEV